MGMVADIWKGWGGVYHQKTGIEVQLIFMLQLDQGWWRGTCKGHTGLFPQNYVERRYDISPAKTSKIQQRALPPVPPVGDQVVSCDRFGHWNNSTNSNPIVRIRNGIGHRLWFQSEVGAAIPTPIPHNWEIPNLNFYFFKKGKKCYEKLQSR